jgi:hypothetical protein
MDGARMDSRKLGSGENRPQDGEGRKSAEPAGQRTKHERKNSRLTLFRLLDPVIRNRYFDDGIA